MATDRPASPAGVDSAAGDPAVSGSAVTDLAATDPAACAARLALAHEGLDDDGQHEAYDRAWRRAGLREAIDRAAPETGYAPPARSTRGATRA